MMPVYTLTWTETQMLQTQVEVNSADEAKELFTKGRVGTEDASIIDFIYGNDLDVKEV